MRDCIPLALLVIKLSNKIGNKNNINFKSFKYKAKLSGNTVGQSAPNKFNAILRNAIIALPLKSLGKSLGSLEMPVIN